MRKLKPLFTNGAFRNGCVGERTNFCSIFIENRQKIEPLAHIEAAAFRNSFSDGKIVFLSVFNVQLSFQKL